MGRNILSVIAGFILAFIIILFALSLSNKLYPTPEGLDPRDVSAIRDHLYHSPGTLIVIIIGHAIAAFIGGLVTTLISLSKRKTAIVFTIFIIISTIMNVVMIPFFLWFVITLLLGVIVGAYTGFYIGSRK